MNVSYLMQSIVNKFVNVGGWSIWFEEVEGI